MSAANFVKTGPVFEGTDDVYGVGHNSFTVSPDGTQDWLVYHSKVNTAPGWKRVIRMQQFGWNADGSPNFGRPAAPGQAMPVPSGQCK
jgi:GH43 family beta-xylosidase